MTIDEYLDEFRKQLKGFSEQEKAVLLEEIRGHFESDEGDPSMGHDLAQRRQKLEAEMGSPQQLAQGFRNVHRPDRWLAVFFLIPNRSIRWLALAANALALFLNGYADGVTLMKAGLWLILPAAVLIGWSVERLNREQYWFVVTIIEPF